MTELIYQINSVLDAVRIFRLGPFSAFDTLGAVGVMVALTPLVNRVILRWGRRVSYAEMIALALPIGFLAHLIFGVDTPFVRMFFGEGGLVPRLALLVLTAFGLRGCMRR